MTFERKVKKELERAVCLPNRENENGGVDGG